MHPDHSDAIDDSYRAFYREEHTRKDAKVVIASEEKAWRLGREVAKRLKIRLGKWYDKAMAECLESYKADV